MRGLALLPLTLAAACSPFGQTPAVVDGGASAGTEGGAEAGAEAGVPPGTCPPGQVACGTSCATDCTQCTSGSLLCQSAGRCVTTCAGCTDPVGAPTPIECFLCDTSQANPSGICAHADPGQVCLSGSYPTGSEHCDCNNGKVSACPGGSQVCLSHQSTDWCITCGEAGLGTDGQPCKNGGKCNTALSPPRCE